MKTIIRNTTLFFLAALTSQGIAQASSISICTDSSAVVIAINSLNLSSPSYSMNPGGITSTNPNFTVSPTSSTNYTLYVTGTNSNSAVVTTSNTIAVMIGAPNFSLTSPNAYTLGCGAKSMGTVSIINAQTNPAPGGAVSYTLLSPGSSSTLPSGTLSSQSTYTVNAIGTYTVVVKDNVSLCASRTPFTITQNTTAPNISVAVPQQTLDCDVSSTQLQGNSTTPNVSYLWSFSNAPGSAAGNTLAVYTNSLATTSTLISNYILTVTDNDNTCQSATVIPMYQNIFPPNAVITSPYMPGGPCSNSLVLTNQSSTGIPSNSGFPTNSLIVGYLWTPPFSSQPTLALSSTYTAQTSGIYTMTAKDMNNGCTKTATVNVILGPVAAFTHTVTNAQVAFTSISTGTNSNTNYFWNFGDGNSSTLQNPTHTYLSGGAHLVTLQVINNGTLCTGSVIQSINVTGLPCTSNSNFSMVPTGTAQIWNATPNYPWNVSSARWDWGDGYSSNTLYTSHQYAAAGMYNICLSVTVSCGDTSTTCTSYSVYRTSEEAMILEVNVIEPELITGIKSAESNGQLNWNIVPNPNTGEFKLNLNSTEAVRVVISDLAGRVVYNQFFEAHSDPSVITRNLQSGMYLVTLETKTQKTTKRMIINH